MRWLANYLRSVFCQHEWEFFCMADTFTHQDWEHIDVKVLDHRSRVDRCKKCGWVWRQRL